MKKIKQIENYCIIDIFTLESMVKLKYVSILFFSFFSALQKVSSPIIPLYIYQTIFAQNQLFYNRILFYFA